MRQQIADQLAVSRSLTKKVQDNQSTDDEADEDAIPDFKLSQDPLNPWMVQRSDKSNVNAEFDFGYKKFIKNKMVKQTDDSDTDSDDENVVENTNNELNVLKASISKLSQIDQDEVSSDENTEVMSEQQILVNNDAAKVITKTNIGNMDIKKEKKPFNSKKSSNKAKNAVAQIKIIKPVATSNWEVESVNDTADNRSEDISTVFENHETTVAKKVEKRLKEMRRNIERLEKASQSSNKNASQNSKEKVEHDNLEYLKLKNKKLKAVIDEELIETSSKTLEGLEDEAKDQPLSKILNSAQIPSQESPASNIDPTRFIEVKPKYLKSAISQGENEYDQLDDDDEQVVPKVNIEEVFEEDDVVASFRQEKEDEMNKDKLEDINLTLPGWGAWGGKGVKPQKRKRNRFISKPPPKMPRRDENKGDIIIKEYKDPKLAVHKVKDVPFPFESVKDYEASIRAPLGNTFIPGKAHKKLIRPSIITKAGKIIEPMDEEELLEPRNRTFRNEPVIKLLGQK